MKNIEVLAPAGNYESFMAGLNNGADAIYLGMGKFNARKKADNFSGEKFFSAVEKAHLFGVKIYVTVNTLVRDDELDDFIETIKFAMECNVDAFIIQDLGVAKIIKECFPGAMLHASTQLGIHNLEGALVAEKLGFSRVVLSRETTLEDIKLIKQNTNLEIEYFVQGALCVCFSGNCYLSSLMFGKSGNRGECLQPCRLLYKNNLNNQENYYLSTRDLCLINNLKILIDAGVTSFKIEGRLRRPGYVAEVVNQYKNAIKNIQKKVDKDTITKLKTSFSRGDFNYNAYLFSNNDGIINSQNQNHLGIEIGKVLSCKPFKDINQITISSNTEIADGDGLKFIFQGKEIASIGVGSVKKQGLNYLVFTKSFVRNDAQVFLTLDSKRENFLLEKTRKIPVDISLFASANNKVKLCIKSGNNSVEYLSDYVCEKAKKIVQKNEIIGKLNKLGDTDFVAEKIEVFGDDFFIPVSQLNEIRRNACDKLKNELLQKYKKNSMFLQEKYTFLTKISSFDKNNCNYSQFVYDINEIKSIDKNTLYIYKPEMFSSSEITKNIEQIKHRFSSINFAINLPIFANFNDIKILKDTIKMLPKETQIVVNNLYGYELLKDEKKIKIICGPGMNVYNKISCNENKILGAVDVIKSVEISTQIYGTKYEIDKQNFPLMTFVHCPFKAISQKNCDSCAFKKDMIYKNNSGEYLIKRYQISKCYFEMIKKI